MVTRSSRGSSRGSSRSYVNKNSYVSNGSNRGMGNNKPRIGKYYRDTEGNRFVVSEHHSGYVWLRNSRGDLKQISSQELKFYKPIKSTYEPTRPSAGRLNLKKKKGVNMESRNTTTSIMSKVRKGQRITQAEANQLTIEDYKKAKNQYRGYQKRS